MYPHFCIKNLNMPTLITQDEIEPKLILNPKQAIAIPAFASLPVPTFQK
jgi:hypothetical protein